MFGSNFPVGKTVRLEVLGPGDSCRSRLEALGALAVLGRTVWTDVPTATIQKALGALAAAEQDILAHIRSLG